MTADIHEIEIFITYLLRVSASFSARDMKASPSGREERAAGSPESPPSRMLWTIGI
jgi:hypothetical protein